MLNNYLNPPYFQHFSYVLYDFLLFVLFSETLFNVIFQFINSFFSYTYFNIYPNYSIISPLRVFIPKTLSTLYLFLEMLIIFICLFKYIILNPLPACSIVLLIKYVVQYVVFLCRGLNSLASGLLFMGSYQVLGLVTCIMTYNEKSPSLHQPCVFIERGRTPWKPW